MALTKLDLKKIKDLIHTALSEFYTTLIQTNYVTKTDLKKELKNLATKDNLKDLKIDLKGDIGNLKEDINDIKEDINDIKEDMSKYATKDDMLTGFDEVLTEIRDMRQEHQVLSGRVYKQHQSQLEDHEERIDSLESGSIVA